MPEHILAKDGNFLYRCRHDALLYPGPPRTSEGEPPPPPPPPPTGERILAAGHFIGPDNIRHLAQWNGDAWQPPNGVDTELAEGDVINAVGSAQGHVLFSVGLGDSSGWSLRTINLQGQWLELEFFPFAPQSRLPQAIFSSTYYPGGLILVTGGPSHPIKVFLWYPDTGFTSLGGIPEGNTVWGHCDFDGSILLGGPNGQIWRYRIGTETWDLWGFPYLPGMFMRALAVHDGFLYASANSTDPDPDELPIVVYDGGWSNISGGHSFAWTGGRVFQGSLYQAGQGAEQGVILKYEEGSLWSNYRTGWGFIQVSTAQHMYLAGDFGAHPGVWIDVGGGSEPTRLGEPSVNGAVILHPEA